MVRVAVLVLALAAGCRFVPGLAGHDAPGAGDGAHLDVGGGGGGGGGDASSDGAFDCLAAWRAGTVRLDSPVALSVNSATANDRDAFLSQDELTLYFSSDRTGGGSKGSYDVWYATRTSITSPFAAVGNMGTPINTSGGESKLAMTADRVYAVFASDRGGGQGGADLWSVMRADPSKAWMGQATTDFALIDTPNDEFDPWLSADGLHLYYAPFTTVPSTYQYLAFASRASRSVAFGAGTPITELISGADDADPTLSPDESIIVFSSLRVPSSGSPQLHNLWYAVRSAGGSFGAPALVPDINTDGEEADPHLSMDGCRLYFSSDRAGTYDLYVASVIP